MQKGKDKNLKRFFFIPLDVRNNEERSSKAGYMCKQMRESKGQRGVEAIQRKV